MKDTEIGIKLDLIAKLLFMQTNQNMAVLEKELIKTDKQKKLYMFLDGKRNMSQLAKDAKISQRMVEDTLPLWEKRGLIIGIGKGTTKRYVNLQNMEI
jgi:hypothetical protein